MPALAGFTTGIVYKSTRGIRAAALAGAIGTGVSLSYYYGSSFVYTKILGKGPKF